MFTAKGNTEGNITSHFFFSIRINWKHVKTIYIKYQENTKQYIAI